jgi:hypothetical protein
VDKVALKTVISVSVREPIKQSELKYYWSVMLTSVHVAGFSALIVQNVIEAALYSSDSMKFWLRIILPLSRSKGINIVSHMRPKQMT